MDNLNSKLIEAFVAAQAEIPSVKKDKTNPHFKNDYATLDAIIDAIRPVLAKHKIGFMQRINSDSVSTLVVGFGGIIECGQCALKCDKDNMQGLGSAITYARRYSLGATFGIATEEDDDAECACQKVKKMPAPEKPLEQRADPQQQTEDNGRNFSENEAASAKRWADSIDSRVYDGVCATMGATDLTQIAYSRKREFMKLVREHAAEMKNLGEKADNGNAQH